jgi:hypothetical protein
MRALRQSCKQCARQRGSGRRGSAKVSRRAERTRPRFGLRQGSGPQRGRPARCESRGQHERGARGEFPTTGSAIKGRGRGWQQGGPSAQSLRPPRSASAILARRNSTQTGPEERPEASVFWLFQLSSACGTPCREVLRPASGPTLRDHSKQGPCHARLRHFSPSTAGNADPVGQFAPAP